MSFKKAPIATVIILCTSLFVEVVHSATIQDDSFELNTSLPINSSFPVPISDGHWSGRNWGSTNKPTIVRTPVKTGKNAVSINTVGYSNGTYIYQDLLENTAINFTWKFSVYRKAGVNKISLIADWDRTRGYAVNVSSISLDDSGTTFVGWGKSTVLPFVFSKDCWHQVEITVNGALKRQTLTIDGEHIKSINTTGGITPAKTIIIGDTSGSAMHGDFVYDNVKIIPATVRGTVFWGTSHSVICKNVTQGTSITLPYTQQANWDCENSGLDINPGDSVEVLIMGIKN